MQRGDSLPRFQITLLGRALHLRFAGGARCESGRRLEPPQALADQVHAAFLGFVRDQDPGWPPYNQSKSIKVFDAKSAVVTEGYESARALRNAGH
jgi:hypothetical protein